MRRTALVLSACLGLLLSTGGCGARSGAASGPYLGVDAGGLTR